MDRATAQAHLDAWLAADLAVTSGQAYQIDTITVTRADSDKIRKSITYWQRVVDGFDQRAAGGASPAALATFGAMH